MRLISLVAVVGLPACFSPEPVNAEATTGGSGSEGTSAGPGTTMASPGSSSAPSTTQGTQTEGATEETEAPSSSSGGGSCGDGTITDPEACDDSNGDAGDGCDAQCQVEDGWTCEGEPSVCSLPDLSVRILAAAFVPLGLDITYVVANTGGAPSGAYRVDLWDTRAGGFDNPPQLGDVGTITFADKPSLPPGGSDQFTDTIPTPASGTHVAFALVDTNEELVEFDENENVSLGFPWTNADNVVHTAFALTDPAPEISDARATEASVAVSVVTSVPEVFFSVNISHPDVSELVVTVVEPGGETRVLVSDASAGSHLGGTTFRDGTTLLSDGSPPYIGEFDPFGAPWVPPPALNGTWTLRIVDMAGGNAGRLNAFSVNVFELDP